LKVQQIVLVMKKKNWKSCTLQLRL